MSEARAKKSRRLQGIIIAVEAVLVTVAFHGIMLLLFSAPEQKIYQPRNKPQRIFMLNFGGKSIAKNDNFKYWLKYGDPTLIAIDNDRTGYGTLMKKRGLRESPAAGASPENPKKVKIDEREIASLFPVSWDLSRNVGGMLKPQPLIPDLKDPVTGKPVIYPRWKDSQGQPMLQLFTDTDAVRKKIKLLKPDGVTVLQVNFSEENLLPRTKVVTSCGKIELDRLAMRTLMARFREIQDKDTLPNPAFIITEWQSFGEGKK